MKIAVIGSGYVGLVCSSCFADAGNQVYCVDIDKQKIEKLSNGKIPLYEPGLNDLISRGLRSGQLIFSCDIKKAIIESEICMITVGTPEDQDGSADLKQVLQVAESIGKYMNGYKMIVNKSTIPVGTAGAMKKTIEKILKKRKVKHTFDVVSNPEFLKEGMAVRDFLSPDRVVIGVESKKAEKLMRRLYDPFFRLDKRIIIMDIKSAEMTKYAANSMLAIRISFMNEIANICQRTGANIDMVRRGIGSDQRIGKKFLFPGIGYGGSCFPKDIKALIKTAHGHKYKALLLEAVESVNKYQKELLGHMIKDYFDKHFGGLKNKKIAIWGLAFKPNTDDMREAPSITIIDILLKEGAKISAYDPEANKTAARIFKKKINIVKRKYDVLVKADALCIMTEWSAFRSPDFDEMIKLLKRPLIFDGRNVYDPQLLQEKKFTYFSIGRKAVV